MSTTMPGAEHTPATWAVQIQFTSDWHCGTGQGDDSGADRTIARDVDGLPYVPAKELKGIWRDASERAAYGLDDGCPGPWSALVDRIFGQGAGKGRDPDQACALISAGDARLVAQWRAALQRSDDSETDAARRMMRDGLTLTRFGVAIDGSTGTARDDMLREIEVARAGLILEAEATISVPTWQTTLVLLAGLRLVEHIGAKRRRGLGRCQITLTRPDSLALVDLIAAHTDDIASLSMDDVVGMTTVSTPESPARQPDSAPATEKWRLRQRVVLRARQPLLATRAVHGNTTLGHEFVPGGGLIPLVLRAIDAPAQSWIRHGRIAVTEATIIVDGSRAVPTPRSLCSDDKGQGWRTDPKLTADLIDEPSAAEETSRRLKPVGGWSVRRNDEFHWARPALSARAHAVIDDETQRTVTDGMFVNQALEAGTLLAFEVWDDGCLDGHWRPDRLPRTTSLARSRRSGYGQVDVEPQAVEDSSASVDAADHLGDVVLALESDSVIMDEAGIPDPSAEGLAVWVQGRLDAALPVASTVTVDDAHVGVVRRDSWFGTLAAPKPSALAIAAGSVIRLQIQPPAPRSVIQAILDAGIGSLHVEGYGRASLREPSSGPVTIVPVAVESPRSASASGRADAEPTENCEEWRLLRQQVWRSEIHRRVVDAAIPHLPGDTSSPAGRLLSPLVTASQLGSLREAARKGAPAVERWVSATRARPAYEKRWGAERLTSIKDLTTGIGALAEWLNSELPGPVKVPDDLAGNTLNDILAILLEEFIRHQTLRIQAERMPRNAAKHAAAEEG